MKKLISLLLTAVLIMGLLLISAAAADTPEEALGELDIYSGGYSMNYLAVNGKVQTQSYTYFLYENTTGEIQEIPAYCVNPNQYGVPQTVPEGESIRYLAEEKASDPKVVGLIANMYPHRSLEELGLDNKYQAFYAGKIALWCYLIPEWDINDVTVAPGLIGSERTIGEKLLDATTRIYTQGMTWDHVAEPQITVTTDREQAYPVTLDGEAYLQQVFTATSDTWVVNHIVNIQFQNPGDVPDGTRITDMNGQDITQVKVSNTGDGYSGQFKVLYPAASVEGRSGWRDGAAASSLPFLLMSTATPFIMLSARKRMNTASSRAIFSIPIPKPACCAALSPTTQILTTRTSPRPLPVRLPSKSPSTRPVPPSPWLGRPSRWWARTETLSASIPRRSPVP